MEKVKKMLGSVRFWYCLGLSVAFLLDQIDVIPGAYAKTVELFAGLGITVRTIESVK